MSTQLAIEQPQVQKSTGGKQLLDSSLVNDWYKCGLRQLPLQFETVVVMVFKGEVLEIQEQGGN